MLLSMTGYGEARFENERLSLSIELRALNNRYLKVSLRAPDPYHLLEAEFEKVIRRQVKRGTLQVQLRCERQAAPQDFRINGVALESYVRQLQTLIQDLGLGPRGDALLSHALELPGVVPEPGSMTGVLHDDWPILEKVLLDALAQLHGMRQEEGKAMAQELLTLRNLIGRHLDAIRQRVGGVAASFRDRLLERVQSLLQDLDVKIDRDDLIREVSIFAERSDIAEEVVRLDTHLDHFTEIMKEPESPGRKLDFLTQEMFREANTIGSKAGDVEISKQVVEIKGALEKIRELVQNVE
ncbi:MAG: YicC family protein [Gemmataceae bacterium]|nr:YicC family protein [Gemmataceae bacterium]